MRFNIFLISVFLFACSSSGRGSSAGGGAADVPQVFECSINNAECIQLSDGEQAYCYKEEEGDEKGVCVECLIEPEGSCDSGYVCEEWVCVGEILSCENEACPAGFNCSDSMECLPGCEGNDANCCPTDWDCSKFTCQADGSCLMPEEVTDANACPDTWLVTDANLPQCYLSGVCNRDTDCKTAGDTCVDHLCVTPDPGNSGTTTTGDPVNVTCDDVSDCDSLIDGIKCSITQDPPRCTILECSNNGKCTRAGFEECNADGECIGAK